MVNSIKTYEVSLDKNNRITLKDPRFNAYKVIEREDGVIILEPALLDKPL